MRRGETFLTRKITCGLSNIALGLDTCLSLVNMGALCDWDHAKDYVRMQWMMLQQELPDDFVIATGKQISVREFFRLLAREIGVGDVTYHNCNNLNIKSDDELAEAIRLGELVMVSTKDMAMVHRTIPFRI